jgi:hypothetical protein
MRRSSASVWSVRLPGEKSRYAWQAEHGRNEMRNRLFLRKFTAPLILSAGFAAQARPTLDQDVVIQNVTLISPERLRPMLHTDVLLENGKISKIGINLVAGPRSPNCNPPARLKQSVLNQDQRQDSLDAS